MKKPVHWICAAALAVICLSAAKNSATRTLTVSEGTNVNVTVSPDRKTIIMDLQETLWSLPIGGGTAKRLTDPFLEPARPDWSPKGDLVAFQSLQRRHVSHLADEARRYGGPATHRRPCRRSGAAFLAGRKKGRVFFR